jgi:hypothetical protein
MILKLLHCIRTRAPAVTGITIRGYLSFNIVGKAFTRVVLNCLQIVADCGFILNRNVDFIAINEPSAGCSLIKVQEK